MDEIKFVAIERDGVRDGTYGWEVHVNGVKVIDTVRDTDMADGSLDPAFAALKLSVKFDWE